ncbi:MAG TPA: peptide chain release factor N(5)-glutamine methyltransferase [Bryobacteraceae bacterium]|jgi:release factor glutamine methyltransferase|nr:peptide chain release factor N(5)-glutamine methyltransferase [Bryobacteraceae bacterium]
MTIQTALKQGQKLLEDAGISAPRLTAEVLLAHAIGCCPRSWLYAHSDEELKEVWWVHYGRYLHQRLSGMPTQYITGTQEFFGRDFRVTPAVLIPRPETEHVIEAALKYCAATALDIGTGSGAIAVTLALETEARVTATDISSAALKVAQSNSRSLAALVDFLLCDLGSALADESFDLVISNPPYVPETDRDTLEREVRDHEPSLALFAGADGLEIYRRLIPEAARLLKPGGRLILELGYNSLEGVRRMLDDAWHDIAIIHDFAHVPRVLSLSRLK